MRRWWWCDDKIKKGSIMDLAGLVRLEAEAEYRISFPWRQQQRSTYYRDVSNKKAREIGSTKNRKKILRKAKTSTKNNNKNSKLIIIINRGGKRRRRKVATTRTTFKETPSCLLSVGLQTTVKSLGGERKKYSLLKTISFAFDLLLCWSYSNRQTKAVATTTKILLLWWCHHPPQWQQ